VGGMDWFSRYVAGSSDLLGHVIEAYPSISAVEADRCRTPKMKSTRRRHAVEGGGGRAIMNHVQEFAAYGGRHLFGSYLYNRRSVE
jgi:hypothetical protein